MTQEDRQLLLADLSARLSYKVKADVMGWDEEKEEEIFVPVTIYSVNTDGYVYFADNDYDITYCSIDTCRLYLRPMSSMTKEENQKFYDLTHQEGDDIWAKCLFDRMVDFCNERYLDYRGLTEKGLALEAPEGMYKL